MPKGNEFKQAAIKESDEVRAAYFKGLKDALERVELEYDILTERAEAVNATRMALVSLIDYKEDEGLSENDIK